MALLQEFREFLKQYNIVALAVAFMMGAAANQVVQSLVDNIIMPLISPLLAGGDDWQSSVLVLGPIALRWGAFLSSLLHFLIIALVIFLIFKQLVEKRISLGRPPEKK